MEVLSAFFGRKEGCGGNGEPLHGVPAALRSLQNGMFTKHILEFTVSRRGGFGLKAMHFNVGIKPIELRAFVPRDCNPVDPGIHESR